MDAHAESASVPTDTAIVVGLSGAAGLRPAFTARRSLDELLDKRTQMAAAEVAGAATP